MEIGGYQVSLGTLALLLVVAFVLWGFVKGVVRLVFGAACLVLGAWVGFMVFRNGSEWLAPLTGGPPSGRSVLYAAWTAGVFVSGATALIGRRLVGKLTGSDKGRGPVGFAGALLSLVPSGIVIWLLAMAVRTTGLVWDLDDTDRATAVADGVEVEQGGLFSGARRALEESWFSGLLKWTDPVASDSEAKLARLLLLMKDPRAWEALQADGAVARLLEEPAVARLVQDSDVLVDVAHSDYARLLGRDELAAAAGAPEVGAKLGELDVDAAVDRALYEEVGGGTTGGAAVGEAASAGGGEPVVEKSIFTRTRKRRRGVKRGAY